MQIIYKFRVHFEEHDDVVRFIDIESTSSFADFHKIIQESVGFDGSKPYSFFMSNDIWRLENQICNSEINEEVTTKLPHQTFLNKYINDPHQRFIYLFDPELDWSFFIELVKILKAEPHKKYPLLARKEGEAPKQNKLRGKLPGATASNEYDKMAEMLMASRLMDELNKPEEEDEELPEDADDLDTDIPDIELPSIDKVLAEKPIIKKPVSFDLKFDEEELKIDDDDFNLFEGEEGEDEEKEEDEDDEFGSDNFGGYGHGDDGNDDY